MRFLILATLLLASCTSQATLAEQRLNAYAEVATAAAELPNHLTGSALVSGLETVALVEGLGLRPFGTSNFSNTKFLAEGLYGSCLDVSETSFIDSNGLPLSLLRIDRQMVEVAFEENLISDLSLTGRPC